MSSPPVQLAGTVTVTPGSTSITFSQNQTLVAGGVLFFSAWGGVPYTLAANVTASTAGTLTDAFSGPAASSTGFAFYSPSPLGVLK